MVVQCTYNEKYKNNICQKSNSDLDLKNYYPTLFADLKTDMNPKPCSKILNMYSDPKH